VASSLGFIWSNHPISWLRTAEKYFLLKFIAYRSPVTIQVAIYTQEQIKLSTPIPINQMA